MSGKTISHYKILEKLRQKEGGQVGEGGMSSLVQNHNQFIPLVGGVDYKTKIEK